MKRVFARMRALRAFENQHLMFVRTDGYQHLIGEIGHHQAAGKPLTIKQLPLLGIGSVATVQRQLRRLRELGLVRHQRAERDHRSIELTLTQQCIRVFAKYDTLMTAKPPPREGPGSGEPRHVCGLCDSDAGSTKLLVNFLRQGLKRGDKCVLVAPAARHNEVLGALPDRRKSPRNLVLSDGYDSPAAQVAFLKRLTREAKQAGQTLRLAADMTWALSRNLRIDAILDIETRLDAFAQQAPLNALCIYDARRFSGGELLQSVKKHRDHLRFPAMLA